jgi:hypothetical protein
MLEIALAITVISLPGLKPLVDRSGRSSEPRSSEEGAVQVENQGPDKWEKRLTYMRSGL